MRYFNILIAGLLCFLLLPLAVLAQSDNDALRAGVEQRKIELENLEAALETTPSNQLVMLRAQARAIRASALEASADIVEPRDRLASELAALGDPPAEGQPAEDESIAKERARLSAELASADALVRQSELNLALTQTLINDIAEARRGAVYDQIFQRQPNSFSPRALKAGLAGFARGMSQTVDWATQETSRRVRNESLGRDIATVLGALLVALVFFIPVRRWLNRRVTRFMSEQSPRYGKQVIAALLRAMARALPAILGGLMIFVSLRMIGVISDMTDGEANLPGVIWASIVALFVMDGVVSSVVANSKVGWRIIPLTLAGGAAVRVLVLTTVTLLSTDAIMRVGAPIFNAPQETVLLQSAGVTILSAVMLVLLTRPSLWRKPIDLSPVRETWMTGRSAMIPNLGILFAILVIGLVLLGYVPLGYFVATRLFFLLALLGLFLCTRAILHEALNSALVYLGASFSGADEGSEEESPLQFWLALALDVILFGVFVVPAVLVVGADWTDVRDAAVDLFFGFSIGSVTISISAILTAIATFLAILSATRAIQVTADTKLFPKTKMDEGVRHSFKTLIGYAGFTIAVLAAIGAIGADLSSLAIVAGALSVGIGFGLQSVVSNFVSGLILLFERPIKVGDWVVTSSGQGYVRKISVRSTEIETFDRSSIIVPNSELIANTVTNMTLGNKLGRVIVPVGVSYDSDPEQVMEILMEIIQADNRILKTPEPFVYFAGLGDSSLDFELRFFLRDIGNSVKISSDIRVAVFKRLRDENIEIPFPQRVIHHVNSETTAT